MEEPTSTDPVDNSAIIFLHFGVSDHFLKLETFIETAESARRVIESLNENLFEASLVYQLIIVPPERGTFLSKIAVRVAQGSTALFVFANTPIGASFIESITGFPPTHWAAEVGKLIKSIPGEMVEYEDEMPEEVDEPVDQVEVLIDQCLIDTRITVELTKAILERGSDALSETEVSSELLYDTHEAVADFYEACIKDKDVKELGFSSGHDFPVKRSSFPERAVRPKRKELKDEPEWQVSLQNIYVTSPNWDREDQKARNWKGKDEALRPCFFVIEDAHFWHLAAKRKLQTGVVDRLRVQWAYQSSNGRPKNRRVLRVLKMNDTELASPLERDALEAILGSFNNPAPTYEQAKLFDFD